MKKSIAVLLVMLLPGFIISIAAQNRYWIAATQANWNDSENWSLSSGGSGGASVPGVSEVAIFDSGGQGDCLLALDITTGGITVNGYTGRIDLLGNTLTVEGTSLFKTGVLASSGAVGTLALNTLASTTFSGTFIDVTVEGTTGRLFLNGSTFNRSFTLTKTDPSSDLSAGGNTFNASTSLTNVSSGYLILGNGSADRFNGNTTINNLNRGRIYYAYNHPGQTTTFAGRTNLNSFKVGSDNQSIRAGESGNSNTRYDWILEINCGGVAATTIDLLANAASTATYNGPVIVSVTNTAPTTVIEMGSGGTSFFNDNITVSINSGAANTIAFSSGATAQSVLAANKTLTIGPSGLTSGTLSLQGFTQLGTTPQNLTIPTGSATIAVGPRSNFEGPVTIKAPGLLLNGCTFNRTANLEKTGTATNIGQGGNIFKDVTTITNSGLGTLMTGNVNADQFQGATTFNITGGAINFAHGPAQVTRFSSSLTVNINKTTGTDLVGLRYCESATSGVVFDGALTINNSGSRRSDIRAAAGAGSTAVYNGPVTLNLTNTINSTLVLMGINGTSTYNDNISISNTGGALPVFFNQTSGGSTLAPGKVISIGADGFTVGSLTLSRFTQLGNTPQTLAMTGSAILAVGPASQFNGNVTFTSPRVQLNGVTFNGTAAITKTGAGTDNSNGGNIFQGATTLTHAGSAILALGIANADQFNAPTTFNVTGTGRLQFAMSHANQTTRFGSSLVININKTSGIDQFGLMFCEGTNTNVVFDGPVTVQNRGSSRSDIRALEGAGSTAVFNGSLRLEVSNTAGLTIAQWGTNGNSTYNDNVQISNSGGSRGITFNSSATASATLAPGKTISLGQDGFTTGSLTLSRFTQIGATPQILKPTGTTVLTIGPASAFDGSVDFSAPRLIVDQTIFRQSASLEKTGSGDDTCPGGNAFIGPATTLINSGSGFLIFGNLQPDIFGSGDLTLTNTGNSTLQLAERTANNLFNGNIIINSTSGGGIYFGNSGGDSQLALGKSLTIGTLGFASGQLRLSRFTQLDPAISQTLFLNGTALLRLGPATTFNGSTTLTAPDILLNGVTFNRITYLEKTGSNNAESDGGNSFLGANTTIVNSGAGYFRFANTSPDVFGTGNLLLENTGFGTIQMAGNAAGTLFNGNITLTSTNASPASGIYFCDGTGGTATLAAGKAISLSGSGFTGGELRLRRFTQLDPATPQVLALTGNSILTIGPGINISGDVDFKAPEVSLNGGTFNGKALIEKTGPGNNEGLGNMTFQSITSIKISGTGRLRTNGNNSFNGPTTLINTNTGTFWGELTSGSQYNGDLTLLNNSSGTITIAFNGANTFSGNVLFNSVAGGTITIGLSAGTSTLASGKTFSIGPSGFSSGVLQINRVTQIGSASQTLTLTGTASLLLSNSIINGNISCSASNLALNGNTFNGSINSFTKTGGGLGSGGGNTFSTGTTTTVTNSGVGELRMGETVGDNFLGNVIFNQLSGLLFPAYDVQSNFAGNITLNGAPIVFGSANGIASFIGTADQTITTTGIGAPGFVSLIVNKTSGKVSLNTTVRILKSATFNSGIVNSSATSYLEFTDNATVTGANNLSFVDGPVRKTGDDAFTFPIGDNTFYRPVSISPPTDPAHFFTAQYFNTNHGLGSAGDPSFVSVTRCEYWQIDRNPGPASNVSVTLSWQEAACLPGYIGDPATLRVARWNGTSWVNQGNGGTTGTATSGTITTNGPVTAFSPFTLASVSLANPLPVELAWLKASKTSSGTGLIEWRTESELNNDRFEIARAENGTEFTTIGTINGAGTSSRPREYQFEDSDPISGIVYYRLKQVDFNGDFKYSKIVSIDFGQEAPDGPLRLAPNPVTRGEWVRLFSGSSPDLQSITIFNALNQAVQTHTNVDSFNTEDLQPGIYIVRTRAGKICRLVVN